MLNAYDSNEFSAMRPNTAQRTSTAPMTIDQQLQLMNTINTMVKNGQFTAQLATTVFALCAQLKTSGVLLEQTNKNELNKVFISLRQACCRDNGQLGTPCRLKIMELVELRAMHWRSNLAHSQYYVNRPEQHQDPPPASVPQQQPQYMQQNSMFMPNQEMAPNTGNGGFYLIPAAGGWMPPILPGGMMPPNPFMQHQPMMPHEALLMRQRSIKKVAPKTMQLRHEMIIRNSDSGKIMGVKGRRVALVEQLTSTVISFQKVDPKSKERTLTITASSMEDIERAKDLIIDTIRRNISPCRADPSMTSSMGGAPSAVVDEDEDDQDISIETTQDGMLKLCCSDPEVLQAAQEALSEYLRVRARPSAEEREKKKERRKSMPLQQNREPEQPVLKPSRSFHGSTPNLADGVTATTRQVIVDQTTTFAGSNYTSVPPSSNRNWSNRSYDRDALLQMRDAPVESDVIIATVTRIAPELLR